MVTKISGNIVGYRVQNEEEQAQQEQQKALDSNIVHMHELVERPEQLLGSTYKLKTPEHISEHSLFITINDIVLNPGTEHELRRPFEIFINSKSLDHYQWIVALTRIMSAVFRKGGDVAFIVEELRSVFDPKGGFWDQGKYVPSLIASIGDVIERHLIQIGLLKIDGLDEHQQALVDAKKQELARADSAEQSGSFPPSAQLCNKCSRKAAIMKDGCLTCLNCGDSKCG
ncbi:NrdJb [Psychromonas aquimarina]|uniref:TSCPD domain-containing protein n=1 Tax=Psychromonas aquimarina TaxID=444919 RepID=UPI000415C891|nr:NrdJb [Psychromonas aquimarina]